MRVVKRNGEYENVSFDKVLRRLQLLSEGLNVDFYDVARQVCGRIYDGVKTTDLDELAAHLCSSLAIEDPDYGIMAARVLVSNLHKNTEPSFSKTMERLFENKPSLIAEDVYRIVQKHADTLDAWIDHSRDDKFDFFGFKTLEKSYLMRIGSEIVERPQHMFMRVAVGIHKDDIVGALETYDGMSLRKFTHATPTLFNAGTPRPQLSSCFLMATNEDSIDGIFETLKETALISKYAGGIGLHVHDVRAKGSVVKGTNGTSDGLVSMLRVYNNVARYVNQAGRRPGSIAIYLEPWHADVFEFLDLKKPHGAEEQRARDLFYALWINDLFMERVQADQKWSLMSPDVCPGLSDAWGDKFRELYESYEREGRFVRQIRAQDLWFRILEAQIETGTPYICYKDASNAKSNQQNLGTIKSSNLCVAPETQILTSFGWKRIDELKDADVEVWNGQQFSPVTVRQTGVDQPLVTVKFSNGEELDCTPYHKFYVQNGWSKSHKSVIVETRNLRPGMKLVKWKMPILNATKPAEEFKYPYTHGLFCADGTYGPAPRIPLYHEKMDLAPFLDKRDGLIPRVAKNGKRMNVQLPLDMPDKFRVPSDQSLEVKMRWLEGYMDGDGCITRNLDCYSMQVSSINKEFLVSVKRMVNTLGADPKISLMKEEATKALPKPIYRMVFTPSDLWSLLKLGFSPKRLDLSGMGTPNRDARKFVRVESIIDNGRRDDTFCFNEPIKHSGVFNGILTSQCSEILEYSSPQETSVCNLASICLPTFVSPDRTSYDFEALHATACRVVKNLDKVIDVNFYPLDKARRSNMRHRPVGMGVQGLADTFALLKMPFDSVEARKLNRDIFETMYHAAVRTSMELARRLGAYETFQGSPASKGRLQFDLWGVDVDDSRYDWTGLKRDVVRYGLRNSLLLAPMPTASTSQIMGFNECFEPFTSNIYKRRTMAGEFILVNKHLVRDLQALGLWNETVRTEIIVREGSVQDVASIPSELRAVYKTAWELSQRTLIDLAADRGAFVCQSQSLNLFAEDPDFKRLTSMHFYAWKRGLKTGIYYLRTRPKARAQMFTIDPSTSKDIKAKKTCVPNDDGVCLMCAS